MIRYTLFLLTVIATAATAVAAVQSTPDAMVAAGANLTVIEKNDPFPVLGPIAVEQCAKEDCSDVPS